MNKPLNLVGIGLAFFVLFVLLKASIVMSMIGLIFLITGILTYKSNYKKISYLILATLLYLTGIAILYLQYKPDDYTITIAVSILVIQLLIWTYLYYKKK